MPRINPGPPCAVCGKASVAQKLCATHYKRLQRHGHIEQTRPADWGLREAHELYGVWQWMARWRRDPSWNDFWAFVNDVGQRPTAEHRLRRLSEKKPYGPGNWYWAEPVTPGSKAKTDRAAYARAWRAQNKMRAKGYDLKRKGISLAEYEALLEKQGGQCAICGQADKWFRLAVDHCHGTHRIRGLLCSQCNRGIGFFKDKPELLERAAQYLRWPERLI